MSAISSIQGQVDEFLEDQFQDFEPESIHGPKVVRDPVHGFIRIEPHEVAIWNTPLLQRLRHIHQTGLATLVYPGANHTRFEHSVGVMEVSQLMLDALDREHDVNEEVRVHVRLAALLHDIGHILFSHLGETILESQFRDTLEEMERDEYRGEPQFFRNVPLGEILAYLMVTSDVFTEWVRDNVAVPRGHTAKSFDLSNINFERIGRMIMGEWDESLGEERWAAEIINGSFDADKLDYLIRDCHYTGVRSEVDTTRLIHTLTIVEGEDWHNALGVAWVSQNYLEQILMAKLTLHTAIYHHHKVRAIECMIKSFYERLDEDDDFIPGSIKEAFSTTEHDFFSRGRDHTEAGNIVRRIKQRQLLKRALVLDSVTIKKDSKPSILTLADDIRDVDTQKDMREKIYNDIPEEHQTSIQDLWIDFPESPDVDEEAQTCPVVMGPSEVKPLSELMPADDWVRSYVSNKLRGHVFYDADEEKRRHAAQASKEFLKSEYGIELEPLAIDAAFKTG